MLKSLASAVSGLKNFTAQLDVIGNNLSNVRTLGFKSSRITFQEARSQNLSGAARGFGGAFGNQKQIGLGVNIASTDLNFTQGSLEFTGVPTDLAIQGNSFFILTGDGVTDTYTRAGNFFFNSRGNLVNPNGLAVKGWNRNDAGEIDTIPPPVPIVLGTNLSSPASATTKVFLSGNLDSTLGPLARNLASSLPFTDPNQGDGVAVAGSLINDLDQTTVALTGGENITIAGVLPDGSDVSGTYTYTLGDTLAELVTEINTVYSGFATASIVNGKITLVDDVPGDSSTSVLLSTSAAIAIPAFETAEAGFTGEVTASITVFDSLGEPHTLILNFTLTPTDGKWSWEANLLGDESILSGSTGTITFDSSGSVISFVVDGTATDITIDPGNAAEAFSVTVDVKGGSGFSGVTQFGSDSTLIVREQNGRPPGSLLRFDIDSQGIITGVFSNEENLELAQIALAEFPNPLGLLRAGNGNFSVASSSGRADVNRAGDRFSSSIISGSLENSNVDLVAQFTDMIVTQRGFQANARVVTTADQILEETMRLKR